MLKRQFSGKLKEYLEGFLREKRTLGFSYSTGADVLNQFDKFCIEKFGLEMTITPELGLAWATKRSNEKMTTLEGRVCVVRELARYMNRCGIEAFVIPKGIARTGVRFTPHIFTKDELTKFFAVLDTMERNPTAPIQHIMFPVLFRLLYSCGLRPLEAVTLASKNIDLKTGVLFIEQSKGHADRNVVVSDDMLRMLRNYRKKVCTAVALDPYFFPNMQGGQLLTSNLNRVFRKCWIAAKIPDPYGNPPRVYDFRHSFATKRLFQWHEAGNDVNALLPYLSAYMGHAHLSATAYYIHLTPEFFPKEKLQGLQSFDDLIPEVSYD